MIFHRALIREMAGTALLVFSVLLTITLTTLLVRLLGQAASGAVANEAIVATLGFSIVGYLPVLLSLTGFVAILMTLTRCYRDSEMVVWFTAGLSVAAWLRPVLRFAVPLAVVIGFLSLLLSPWALHKSEEYSRQMESREEVAGVSPGVFKESKQADRVYFVEGLATEKGTVSNVFMRTIQHQKLGILVAKHGYLSVAPNGDRFMVLLNGRRYEGDPNSPAYKIMAFERYAVRIQPYEAKFDAPTQKTMTTLALLQRKSPADMGELLWRIGLPLSAVVLAALAIPLSFVNPRAGRSLNLIMAILIYMIYSNFLSIAQAWVAQGKLNPYLGIAGVHGFMLLVLLTLFYRRLTLGPLFPLQLKQMFAPERR